MKKILALVLALGATALLACPMQAGKCGTMCGSMMAQKCTCDTSKLPPHLENLGLNDKQKEEVQQIRKETQTFRNKQHEKVMAVLTPDQRKKLETATPAMCPKGDMQMPAGGMGCKKCPTK